MIDQDFRTRRLLAIGLEKGHLTLDDLYRFFPPHSIALNEFLDVVDRIADAGLEIAPGKGELPAYTRWRS